MSYATYHIMNLAKNGVSCTALSEIQVMLGVGFRRLKIIPLTTLAQGKNYAYKNGAMVISLFFGIYAFWSIVFDRIVWG